MSSVIDGATGLAFLPWLGWWGTAAALAVAAARPEDRRGEPADRLRLDVVIPAHDEEATIGQLVEALRSQEPSLHLGRVLVVADHCTDRTAEVARAAGVDVLERHGLDRGKPPALRDGLNLLRERDDRGDAVVLVDGDCAVEPGFLAAISAGLASGAEALQAACSIADGSSGAVRSSLRRSYGLRNVVRASGRERFGLPCLFFGTGIVLRWELLDALSFADPRMADGDSRPVGDDTLMTLELLRAGHEVRFCADARVVATAPDADADLGTQRLRWEAGQVMTWKLAAGAVPGLLKAGDLRSLVALADWMMPPLAPSVAVFGGTTLVTVALVAVGAASPVVLALPVLTAAALATYLGVGVSVLEGRRAAVELFVGAPRYLAWKADLYRRHRGSRAPGRPAPTA